MSVKKEVHRWFCSKALNDPEEWFTTSQVRKAIGKKGITKRLLMQFVKRGILAHAKAENRDYWQFDSW